MIDQRNRHNSGAGAGRKLRRRDFVTGSLATGAGLAAGATAWNAWSQTQLPLTPMPTIPIECVPPVPFGQASAFAPPGGPVRIRKSVFELDANEISRLRAAYAELLKITKNNDPRGWYRQGAVHCWYCSGAADSLNGMEIHGSWWFLAWHRAYLYFHERILGALIGDPTFALPYWDWDSCKDDPKDMTGRNRFPGDVYGFPTSDPAVAAANSLYDTTRAVGPNDRIDTAYVGPTVMKAILGSKSFTDFGGSGNEELPVFGQQKGDPQQAGHLESGPHGLVHLWTTDPKNYWGLANMGMLAAAAFDPVFFAHHANIDRLWSVWAGTPGHANPSNDRWLNQQAFYFYDQAQTWIGIVPSQMVDSEKSLSYRYQPPQWPPGAVVAAAAPAALAENAVRLAQATPLSAPLAVLSTGTETKTLPAQATTLQIAVPTEARQRITALVAGAAPTTLVLRIDGVEISADRSAVVQVFVNRPDVTAPVQGPEAGYVGSIVIVASTPSRTLGLRPVVTRNFGLPLSPELAAELSGKDNLTVTLVPVTGANKPAEVLRYRQVYLASR
jgi:polyphenol oxidase